VEAGSATGLLVHRVRSVGWIVFDRPAALNAMDAAMMMALPQAWRQHDADAQVGAIVVTGTGEAFQSGLDMAQLSRDRVALREMSRRTREFDLQLTGWQVGVRKPVIVAVNGVCAGAGLHFVADADVVIASTTATFVDPHVSVGLVSALEPIGLMKKGVSVADVMRMALVGEHERMSATRARQLGMVSELVEPAQLRAAAQSLGEQIAMHDKSALDQLKTGMWQVVEGGEPANG